MFAKTVSLKHTLSIGVKEPRLKDSIFFFLFEFVRWGWICPIRRTIATQLNSIN